MSDLNTLMSWKREMKGNFQSIKDDPLNINKLMEHVATLSTIVENLIDWRIQDGDLFHQAHMTMLTKPDIPMNDGSLRPAVADIRPWKALGTTVKAGRSVNLSEISRHRIKFWSDTHFFQEKIIGYTNRPYANIAEMHERMVANFIANVSDTDIVIWVGDVSFAGVTTTNEILDRLPGYNILVVGNHDLDRHTGKLKMMNFKEIHTNLVFDEFVVTHHPWKQHLPSGMWNIHGHLHDSPLRFPRHISACVEMINYTPKSLQDMLDMASGYYDRVR